MSFSYKIKLLRSENSYDSNAQLEMSADEEKVTGEVKTGETEGDKGNSKRFSPDSVDERIKASLETLHSQICALTEVVYKNAFDTSRARRTC